MCLLIICIIEVPSRGWLQAQSLTHSVKSCRHHVFRYLKDTEKIVGTLPALSCTATYECASTVNLNEYLV